jgi:hypothetical protein
MTTDNFHGIDRLVWMMPMITEVKQRV